MTHTRAITAMLLAQGAVSAKTNPQPDFFEVVRRYLSSTDSRYRERLVKMMKQLISEIAPDNIPGWFIHFPLFSQRLPSSIAIAVLNKKTELDN